jgi:small-conductance mechanosensitive channel
MNSNHTDQKRNRPWLRMIILLFVIGSLWTGSSLAMPGPVQAQGPQDGEATPTTEAGPEAPAQVDVQPLAQDEQIDERLTRILEATEWFVSPVVVVRDGVVFLDGQTTTEDYRVWAGNLARNTQDVVAVVNRIEIIPQPIWDFTPAIGEVRSLYRAAVQAIPVLVFGVAVLVLAWSLMRPIEQLSKRLLRNRLGSPLLTGIAARTIAIPVFLLGLYLVLQVAGLTRLAITLLGGTGIVGIVIGFAFRDIAENFLASILLSMRQPFRSDDLIEVAGHTGVVQQMNTRSTVLMTLDGNHIQIPNATVFKSTIINYTANPNRRSDFTVGIGYDDGIANVQTLIAQVLGDHPAVLANPEPLVLVDNLGAAAVQLRVYFWYDATQYAPIKIKSSLIRLTKQALAEAGVTMPDEAREVIFPKGIPLIRDWLMPDGKPLDQPTSPKTAAPEPVTTAAEGHLHSEDRTIREQAEQSRSPEEGEDLLDAS